MTGPRVEVPPANLTRILSPDEFDQAQTMTGRGLAAAPFEGLPASTRKAPERTGLPRILSADEFDRAQTMSGPAVQGLTLPAIPPLAPRDATATARDNRTKGKPLAPFDISDPTTYANPVLRQIVNPALDNPLTTLATTAALPIPGVGQVVGLAMAGSMVHTIASYGWQKLAEHQLSPEDRARAEADPERVSGEAAAVQAAMLGLAPLIHVGVKTGAARYAAYKASLPMVIRADISHLPPGPPSAFTRAAWGPRVQPGDLSDWTIPVGTNRFIAELEQGAATARIPTDASHPEGYQPTASGVRLTTTPRKVPGLIVPEDVTPGKVKPLATDPASAPLQAAADLNASVRDYQAERVAQDEADLSAARTAAADKIAKADAMRPRRRPAKENYFETEQGAEVLGAMAARHGLPEDASPYHPDSPLADVWQQGHAAATESYPEGFSMGGALTDNRIPGAGEIPPAARGVDAPAGFQPSLAVVPEGATPESIALANALRPSPYRTHTVDELAGAAVDAQADIERAQQAVVASQTKDHAAWNDPEQTPEHIFYEDRGVHASDTPAAMHEKALARAKSRMAQIERELALRGVSGDKMAELMQGAQEQRAERAGIQSDEALAAHMGAEDPFAAPTTPSTGLTPVEGTGETKTRGLAAGVKAKAVANKLTTTLGDLPEYQTINMAAQARGAAELLAADPALARRIALGEVPPPAHLLPESVFTAVENKAIAEGDVATIRDLATGKLTSDATTMGQRIRALGERDPESPVGAIQKVVDARSAGETDIPAATEKAIAQIRKHMAKANIPAEQLAEFINALRC